ncbi:MAG: LPS export ABC transporter periplasmic protein LptC [bacterium]
MKNFLTLSAILFFLGMFLSFWDSPPQYFLSRVENIQTEDDTPKADSFMRNITSSKFSESGEREILITATNAEFFEPTGRLTFSDPHLTFYGNESGVPWELSSRLGEAVDNAQRITLHENVRMWQTLKLDDLYELKTESLNIYPSQKLASTDDAVNISGPQGVTRGTGMVADMENETFDLLADVEGVHRGL